FGADRFGLAVRDDVPVIASVCQLPDVLAGFAEVVDEDLLRRSRQLANRADAEIMQAPFALLADAPDSADRKRRQKFHDMVWIDYEQAVGLTGIARQLGQVFVGRHADGGD